LRKDYSGALHLYVSLAFSISTIITARCAFKFGAEHRNICRKKQNYPIRGAAHRNKTQAGESCDHSKHRPQTKKYIPSIQPFAFQTFPVLTNSTLAKPIPTMFSKSKLLLVLSVLIQMMLISCKEEETTAEAYVAIYKCQQQNNYDEAATRRNIIGSWEWKYSAGGDLSPAKNTESAKDLKIKFNADGSGTIMTKDTSGTFTWTIEIKDSWTVGSKENQLYGFRTVPFISQLSGRLLFCDDLMMGNNSYIDGVDNVFKKQ
jgi:hypothetical protein